MGEKTMLSLNRILRSQQILWAIGGLIIALAIALFLINAVPWQHSQGDSLLYGKVSDTRHWYDTHGHNLIANAKVTINSLPPQTTYTDDKGQFWFKGLRNINYAINIANPQENGKHYTFVTRVNGRTGRFYDLASDEKHNLKEMDY
jgi:hypothetical protein